jgi:hypothetical protein
VPCQKVVLGCGIQVEAVEVYEEPRVVVEDLKRVERRPARLRSRSAWDG